MASQEDEPYAGCGRGGRGALLRAALQQTSRRPGSEGGDDAPPTVTSVLPPAAPPAAPPASPLAASPTQDSGRLSGDSGRSSGDSGRSSGGSSSSGNRPPSGSLPRSPFSDSTSTTSSSSPLGAMGRGGLLGLMARDSSPSLTPSPTEELGKPGPPPSRGVGPTYGHNIVRIPAEESVIVQQMSIVPSATAAPPQARAEPLAAQMSKLEVKDRVKDQGKSGKPVSVEVNYVRLGTRQGMGVFEYHTDFVPVIDSKRARCKLLSSDPAVEIIGRVKVFDGTKLYLPHHLKDQVTCIQTVLDTDGMPVMVKIKFIKKTPPSECLHLYNVLFKKIMHCLQLTQIGRNYFDQRGAVPVPQHRLEVWPGYVQSIAEYDGGLMLNCDISFRILRNMTVREALFDICNAYPNDYKAKAIQAIVGSVVMTRYNNATYRVDDISWDLNPTCTFLFHNGEQISYVEYYKRMYDIDIRDNEQPLLLNRGKARKDAPPSEDLKLVCLVPELCTLTGITDNMRADFRVMKDITAHTRVGPERRKQSLEKYVKNVKACPAAMKILDEWGVSLEDCALNMEARILQEEKIMMRNKTHFHNGTADWGRLLSQDSVISAVNLDYWVVIFTRRDTERTRGFVSMMCKVGPPMGIQVRPPQLRELPNDHTDNYVRAIKEVITKQLQVIVIIFPTSRDDRYSAVKRLCCVEMPVASQVIISNTIGQPQKLRSVVQKVALQINCKLGGELWAVDIPVRNVMVVGIDVYHDRNRGKQSVVGFVASMNHHMTRWFSKVAFQDPGKELVNSLRIAFLEALVKYYEVNHTRPDRIFIFRDGVSDGQLNYVNEFEIEQLIAAFGCISDNYNPTIAVVVVQKRINTRIFAKLNGVELDNPMPGTVVDHTITRPDWCDFFLVSQKVRQGTVSPTHYVVIRNSTGLSPDQLQRLTYKLTHLYYNWPGTVRVPAPCQYAHKLANLVGDNIHREPSPLLCDRLFYL